MGIKEFSTSLADFNQQQLDQIESDTAAIHQDTETIKNTNLTQLSTNVGSDADLASGSGSVHAKIKDLKSTVGTVMKSRSARRTTGYAGVNVLQTILSVSGAGKIVSVRPEAGTNSIQINIDGQTIIATGYAIPSGNYVTPDNIASTSFARLDLSFKTSAQVLAGVTNTSSSNINVAYEVE